MAQLGDAKHRQVLVDTFLPSVDDGRVVQALHRGIHVCDIDDRTLGDIRQATNNAWVLGNDRFRQSIEELTQRQAAPKPKGGDKRSKEYRESHKTVRV